MTFRKYILQPINMINHLKIPKTNQHFWTKSDELYNNLKNDKSLNIPDTVTIL